MTQHNYYVYFVTNWTNECMYIGITNNLKRRIYEHKIHIQEGFTDTYNLVKLVYYEHYTDVNDAIFREKQLKKFRREKKDKLVDKINPDWKDLAADWYDLPKVTEF